MRVNNKIVLLVSVMIFSPALYCNATSLFFPTVQHRLNFYCQRLTLPYLAHSSSFKPNPYQFSSLSIFIRQNCNF